MTYCLGKNETFIIQKCKQYLRKYEEESLKTTPYISVPSKISRCISFQGFLCADATPCGLLNGSLGLSLELVKNEGSWALSQMY